MILRRRVLRICIKTSNHTARRWRATEENRGEFWVSFLYDLLSISTNVFCLLHTQFLCMMTTSR